MKKSIEQGYQQPIQHLRSLRGKTVRLFAHDSFYYYIMTHIGLSGHEAEENLHIQFVSKKRQKLTVKCLKSEFIALREIGIWNFTSSCAIAILNAFLQTTLVIIPRTIEENEISVACAVFFAFLCVQMIAQFLIPIAYLTSLHTFEQFINLSIAQQIISYNSLFILCNIIFAICVAAAENNYKQISISLTAIALAYTADLLNAHFLNVQIQISKINLEAFLDLFEN